MIINAGQDSEEYSYENSEEQERRLLPRKSEAVIDDGESLG